MKVGRKLAIKILNVVEVRAWTSPATSATTSRPVTQPLDRSLLAALADDGRRSDGRVRRLRLRPCARTHRAVLLVVLRRLRRAREGPRPTAARATTRRARRQRRCASRCRRCCDCSRRCCRSSPKKCGRGGRKARSTARRGRTRRARASARRPARVHGRGRGARRGAQGEVGAEGVAGDAGRAGRGVRHARTPRRRCAPRSTTCGSGQDRGRRRVTERARAPRQGRARSRRERRERPSSFHARAWLDGHVNLETGVGAPRVSGRAARRRSSASAVLLPYLGSPEIEFPAIHITGTNGKTTTARMIAQLLDALGLHVGTFTSPHLERVNERMSIDGEPIDDDTLDEMLYAVRARRAEQSASTRRTSRSSIGGRVPLVRRRGRRRRGRRGRAGRHVGRDERRRRPKSRSSPT